MIRQGAVKIDGEKVDDTKLVPEAGTKWFIKWVNVNSQELRLHEDKAR